MMIPGIDAWSWDRPLPYIISSVAVSNGGTSSDKDADKDDFIARLSRTSMATQTPWYAWALLSNHLHLLLRTGNTPIAIIMRKVLTGYVASFNRRYHRNGHLFQNRYKSILCQEDSYLLELVRYIHLNPLRAKLVQSMEQLDAL